MKRRCHYCKICGEYRSNETLGGKGPAAHICKKCSELSASEKAEQETLTKLLSLPAKLSKVQMIWLRNRAKDKRPAVQRLAMELYAMQFTGKK